MKFASQWGLIVGIIVAVGVVVTMWVVYGGQRSSEPAESSLAALNEQSRNRNGGREVSGVSEASSNEGQSVVVELGKTIGEHRFPNDGSVPSQGEGAANISVVQINEPVRIVVHEPGGYQIAIDATLARVNVDFGHVARINIYPLQQPVPYGEVRKAIDEILGQLPESVGSRLQEKIAKWPQDVLDHGEGGGIQMMSRQASVPLSEDARISVIARPAAGGGWTLVISLGLSGEARRSIYPVD